MEVYASWYDHPARFNYIQDFCDIRAGLEGLKSHLSRLPRYLSPHPAGKSIFYNPVKCLPESPIYKATAAWLNAVTKMRENDTFDSIIKETAIASFGYEHEFVYNKDEEVKKPSWYSDVNIFTFDYPGEDPEFRAKQTARIREILSPIEKSIKETCLDELSGTNNKADMRVVFSVMLRPNENDAPSGVFVTIA
jgi:hypothetical protein